MARLRLQVSVWQGRAYGIARVGDNPELQFDHVFAICGETIAVLAYMGSQPLSVGFGFRQEGLGSENFRMSLFDFQDNKLQTERIATLSLSASQRSDDSSSLSRRSSAETLPSDDVCPKLVFKDKINRLAELHEESMKFVKTNQSIWDRSEHADSSEHRNPDQRWNVALLRIHAPTSNYTEWLSFCFSDEMPSFKWGVGRGYGSPQTPHFLLFSTNLESREETKCEEWRFNERNQSITVWKVDIESPTYMSCAGASCRQLLLPLGVENPTCHSQNQNLQDRSICAVLRKVQDQQANTPSYSTREKFFHQWTAGSLQRLTGLGSQPHHLSSVLQRLFRDDQTLQPVVVIDGSNLKRHGIREATSEGFLDIRKFQHVVRESFVELGRALIQAVESEQSSQLGSRFGANPQLVVIWDGVTPEVGCWSKLKSLAIDSCGAIELHPQKASSDSIFKKMVYMLALEDLQGDPRNKFEVIQLHAGGEHLSDADLAIASYAKERNAALVWSRDNDYFFLGVNWWCGQDLTVEQCTVFTKQAIQAALELNDVQLRALGYRRGNDYFNGKEVSASHVRTTEFTVKSSDLLELRSDFRSGQCRLDRYEDKIARANASLDVSVVASFKAACRERLSQREDHPLFTLIPPGATFWDMDVSGTDLRYIENIERLSVAHLIESERHHVHMFRQIRRLRLLLNERALLRGNTAEQSAFDPFFCAPLTITDFEMHHLKCFREILQKGYGERAWHNVFIDAYTHCKISNRAFDLVLRRHVWWDSTNVPIADLWAQLADVRSRLYHWVFQDSDVRMVEEEAFTGARNVLTSQIIECETTEKQDEFMAELRVHGLPTFSDIWSAREEGPHNDDVDARRGVLEAIMLGSVGNRTDFRHQNPTQWLFNIVFEYINNIPESCMGPELKKETARFVDPKFVPPHYAVGATAGGGRPDSVRHETCQWLQIVLYHICMLALPLSRLRINPSEGFPISVFSINYLHQPREGFQRRSAGGGDLPPRRDRIGGWRDGPRDNFRSGGGDRRTQGRQGGRGYFGPSADPALPPPAAGKYVPPHRRGRERSG